MLLRAVGMASALVVASSALADSVNVSFDRFTSNASENVEAQFNVEVKTVSGSSMLGGLSFVDFIFTNTAVISSSISEVYFDNGVVSSLFTSGAIESQVGTSFVFGSANPGELPSGNTLTPAFETTLAFLADAQGNPSLGVDTPTDALTLRFALVSLKSFSDVASALDDGSLRIGLHVRSIGANGQSDSFVNGGPPPIVPLPGPGAMGAAGLLTVFGARRRRRV